MKPLPLLLAILSGFSPLAAAVRYVDNVESCARRNPCYPTIMQAVEAAGDGDVIEVLPGVYHEDVAITELSNITLRAFTPDRGASRRRHVASRFMPDLRPDPAMPVIACGSAACPAVSVLRSPGVRIENLLLETGLDVVGVSENAVIQGNVFTDELFFSTCSRSTVRENHFLAGDVTLREADGCILEGNVLCNGQIIGGFGGDSQNNLVHGNVVSGGGIRLTGESASRNRIEFNVINAGELVISSGPFDMDGNIVRRNTVRGAGIRLTGVPTDSLVEGNFVSGSSGDGIRLESIGPMSGSNVIRLNTSVENADCDLNDVGEVLSPNTWQDNRFGTACGNATGQAGTARGPQDRFSLPAGPSWRDPGRAAAPGGLGR